MGKYNIFYLFEKPRRGMQARNFTTNVPKILYLKSSSEQIFPRKLSLGAPDEGEEIKAAPKRNCQGKITNSILHVYNGQKNRMFLTALKTVESLSVN